MDRVGLHITSLIEAIQARLKYNLDVTVPILPINFRSEPSVIHLLTKLRLKTWNTNRVRLEHFEIGRWPVASPLHEENWLASLKM